MLILSYLICIHIQGNLEFAMYTLNVINWNDIYTNGWPKIKIQSPDRVPPLQYIMKKVPQRPFSEEFLIEPF